MPTTDSRCYESSAQGDSCHCLDNISLHEVDLWEVMNQSQVGSPRGIAEVNHMLGFGETVQLTALVIAASQPAVHALPSTALHTRT